jgi:biotin carboxyl carrier protein
LDGCDAPHECRTPAAYRLYYRKGRWCVKHVIADFLDFHSLDIQRGFQYQTHSGRFPGTAPRACTSAISLRRFDVMAKQITAPMPGKVIDILVKEGEDVLEYQDVLVLEAMKMENAIPAPEAGRIKKINVKKDDTVVTQQVLMVLE